MIPVPDFSALTATLQSVAAFFDFMATYFGLLSVIIMSIFVIDLLYERGRLVRAYTETHSSLELTMSDEGRNPQR